MHRRKLGVFQSIHGCRSREELPSLALPAVFRGTTSASIAARGGYRQVTQRGDDGQ
jgi:hypothetical protein